MLQIKGDPKATAQLGALLQNKDGTTLTYQDQSGKLSLTVAGQAKVQAVFNTLKLTETFDVKNFPDQQTAQIVTLVAAVVLTVCSGGAGAALIGAVQGSLTAAMANAAFITMASTMVGKMAGGASFGQAFEAGVKAGATSALMAGVSFGINQWVNGAGATGNATTIQSGGQTVQSGTNAAASNLSTLDRMGAAAYWQQTALNAMAQGTLSKLQGGSFQQGFTGSVIGSLSASGAGVIGDLTKDSTLTNIGAHAILGGASAAASGKDCGSGALGGATSAGLARVIDSGLSGSNLSETTQGSIIAGGSVLGSVAVAGVLGKDMLTAGNAATNEVLNNALSHRQATVLTNKIQACAGETKCINDVVYNAILLSNKQAGGIDQEDAKSAIPILQQLAGDPSIPLSDANRNAIVILAYKNEADYRQAGSSMPSSNGSNGGSSPFAPGWNSGDYSAGFNSKQPSSVTLVIGISGTYIVGYGGSVGGEGI